MTEIFKSELGAGVVTFTLLTRDLKAAQDLMDIHSVHCVLMDQVSLVIQYAGGVERYPLDRVDGLECRYRRENED